MIKPVKYDFSKIEKKWQTTWNKSGLHLAKDGGKKPKWYQLVEFPYPSGAGLHVGHVRSYTAMDVVSRKRRMQGYNVLYPMGWDAFGLPTANYAAKTGIHPIKVTRDNTNTFRRQLQGMGFSFDWSREINTTDPEYYKWTQWIFLQLYKHGLAYKGKSAVNWCPSCKIVLANEEVIGGKCERCGGPTEEREKEQWMLRITKYADKLLAGLKTVDFLPSIRSQQENWIGRKEGINITYSIDGGSDTVTVFTTRPDTNFGATFVVLAPEHPLVEKITDSEHMQAVRKYVASAGRKTEEERISEGHKKTGVFTGRYAVNHLTGRKMPLWISDFVLGGFGTGAVVGVPGHDMRDFEFAKEFGLEIIRVVVGGNGDKSPIERPEQVQEEEGTMINSGFLDGLEIHEATRRIMDHIEKNKWGIRTVSYHLRDWVFSRQHYWGEPIPMIFCEKCGWQPVPEKDLPVKLPTLKDFKPRDDGESPLVNAVSWLKTRCPECGASARRETDVMPNWAGSSWYYLRYVDPKNKKHLADPKKLKHWMPVDWYNGGMEHTTLHVLYSRFWNQFLHDIGVSPVMEPYAKRTSHGMVLGEGGIKMSKSKGNVVNPDDVVRAYGADTLRLYELFMGPFDQAIPWDPKSIEGVSRFLNRVWTIHHEKVRPAVARSGYAEGSGKLRKLVEKTIKKVGEDIESTAFNTAVSAMMIFINSCQESDSVPVDVWKKFLAILAPFAPHITEELWQGMRKKTSVKFSSVHSEKWPAYDPKLIQDETFTLVIQMNGKVRDGLDVPAGIGEAEAKKLALASEKISSILSGAEPKRVIYVPGRLINIVF